MKPDLLLFLLGRFTLGWVSELTHMIIITYYIDILLYYLFLKKYHKPP